MQRNWSGTRPHPAIHAASDRDLCTRLARRDTAALGCLYDRYAPFVFTVLCDATPEAAEALLENVFVELWSRGAVALRTNLVPMLLQLTAEAVVHHRGAPAEQTSGTSWGGPLLPAVAPFSMLPDGVFDVLVLTCLGGLTCAELAIAFECERSVIYQRLSTGVATLRAERVFGQMPGGGTAQEMDRGASTTNQLVSV